MSVVNHNINNLSGGISRQPDEARFDNQVEDMVNFVPTVSNGLKRRNRLELINSDTVTFTNNMPVHSYDRGDGLEKYNMIIVDNELRIYDINGNKKTVNSSGTNPLIEWQNDGNPIVEHSDCKFLTVGDTTWLLNRNITAKVVDEKTPVGTIYKAFYWIKRSFNDGQNGGYTYYVSINGNTYSSTGTNSYSSAVAMSNTLNGISGITAKNIGSIVYITSEESFTFGSSDSWGDQASIGWTNSVAKISDLPAKMLGFTEEEVGTIAITGTDKDSFTSYYLKWNGEYWSETAQEGIYYQLSKQSLPAKIVRQSDGTFVIGFVHYDETVDGFQSVWKNRVKGDGDSNPLPSFIGSKISNLFFFKNRLGFTSEENVILSEAGSYYNFFATTVIELVDSDPIDASVDSDTVSIIRNVNATAGSLTLWSDNSQFVLSGGDVLSPSTTRIGKTSSYACDNNLSPIVLDNELMFFRKIGESFEVLSYRPASINTDTTTADSLSTHIEGYLPSTIDRVVTSSGNNMVFFTDSENRNKIYVYKYFIQNSQKIMSAWSEWELSSTINSLIELDNVLYVLCDDNKICKIELYSLPVTSNFVDVDTTTGIHNVSYESRVRLSRFNIETKQGTRIIREPFYVKNIKVNRNGECNLNIINTERGTEKEVLDRFLNRKIFIGGNSEKVYIEFKTSYNGGCNINAISVEGVLKIRSRNI